MSKFITLADARLAFEHTISTDDFVDLVNRAGERLYRMGASPGWEKEITLGVPDANGDIITDFNDTSHVLAFKVNGNPYYVTPLSTLYRTDRSGGDRFVDMGYLDGNLRIYRLPQELLRKDQDYTSYEITALIKVSYLPVVDEGDSFPFQNMGPLKLASMSIQYEDNSDIERATYYWDRAIQERETDAREYRGPQIRTIGVHDPASDEATESIV